MKHKSSFDKNGGMQALVRWKVDCVVSRVLLRHGDRIGGKCFGNVNNNITGHLFFSLRNSAHQLL